jgi:hypothetical protein
MSKKFKIFLAVLLGLVLVGFVGFKLMQSNTKKHSPESTVKLKTEQLAVEVFYNRPYKKDRTIFGGLVPYGEVWRTGANEATTFTTTSDLTIGSEILPAGTYTLWTIPGGSEWQIIFNSKMYSWGVNLSGEASREPDYDVLKVTRPVEKIGSVVEQFTIKLTSKNDTQAQIVFQWDKTRVTLPITSAVD